MSTPRRDCPRSSGTPMIQICLGVSMCSSGLVAGLVAIVNPICGESGIQPIQHTRERNCLAHVVESANPRHGALDTHAEARVRHSAELAQVKVPLESFLG